MQTPMPQRRTMALWPIFAAINGILIALVTYAIGTNNLASLGSAAYVITLSGLCFLPLCLTPSVRGRHALSLTFLALYFYLLPAMISLYCCLDYRLSRLDRQNFFLMQK